jgi:hypothetical protein
MSSPEPPVQIGSAPITSAEKASFVKAMFEGIKKPSAKAETPAPEVEILRKIPAPVETIVRPTPESATAIDFASALEAKLSGGELDVLTPEAMQKLLAALCKLYGANIEAGNDFPALNGRMAASGTDVMILCGALLQAADLQVFELGMWQSWSGR